MTKSTSEKSWSLIWFSNDTVLIPQFPLLLGTTRDISELCGSSRACYPRGTCTTERLQGQTSQTSKFSGTEASVCSERTNPAGTEGKGEHPWSQKTLSTCLSYSLRIHPVPQGREERMQIVVPQAQTAVSLSPPPAPTSLISIQLFPTLLHIRNLFRFSPHFTDG